MISTDVKNEMTVRFPGGKRVEALYGEHVLATDQPAANGGCGGAPAPFDLFLASLATCSGYYVLSFCEARGIPTEGLALGQRWLRDAESGRLTDIFLELSLPEGFPKKYEKAVLRAAEQCSVKRLLADPPRVSLGLRR